MALAGVFSTAISGYYVVAVIQTLRVGQEKNMSLKSL